MCNKNNARVSVRIKRKTPQETNSSEFSCGVLEEALDPSQDWLVPTGSHDNNKGHQSHKKQNGVSPADPLTFRRIIVNIERHFYLPIKCYTCLKNSQDPPEDSPWGGESMFNLANGFNNLKFRI